MPDEMPKEEEKKSSESLDTSKASHEDKEAPADDSLVARAAAEPGATGSFTDIPEVSANVSGSAFTNGQKKKSKKKWFVGGIIVVVLALLGAGGVLAYNVWYQNPDKVLSDAIGNLFSAATYKTNGTLVTTSKSPKANGYSKITMAFSTQSDKSNGVIDVTLTVESSSKTYTISGSGLMAENGDLYVKVKGLKDLLKSVSSQTGASSSAIFNGFIQKIDNHWIKIEASKLKEFSQGASDTQECVNKIQDKIKSDSSLLNGVLDAYNKNKFIVVKDNLGVKDGSIGYSIKGDKDKAKSFTEAVKNTELYKEYVKCDPSLADMFKSDDATNVDDSNGTATMEVWINQWSHQFTKVSLTSTDAGSDFSLVMNLSFNQSVNVTPPSDSLTLDDLKAEIQKAEQSYLEQAYGSSYSKSSYVTSNSI